METAFTDSVHNKQQRTTFYDLMGLEESAHCFILADQSDCRCRVVKNESPPRRVKGKSIDERDPESLINKSFGALLSYDQQRKADRQSSHHTPSFRPSPHSLA